MATPKFFDLAMSICLRQTALHPKKANSFGAVGVRPDGLVVSSYNVLVEGQRTLRGHAEYRLHSKLISGSDVYLVRTGSTPEPRLAKPCVACETLLRQRRVRRVYYSIGTGEYGVLQLMFGFTP